MMRLSFIVLALALLIPAAACAGDFIRGDANGDGAVSVADVQSILNYVYRGDGTGCLEALDVNAP